eukprot:CAMPEP_0115866124 /NCGR_PEP_ID=MMETSP0287-20121206/20086_1 /TAXON_ID=412157 /ORGANISM="Chrysochromulina rotalis, Strain UIO044" /LENGTH=177 /DNA_ID=CAMNT_0003320679 /DNA_START=14 /DNA_END=547 /DNA_ORIENTATION=+
MSRSLALALFAMSVTSALQLQRVPQPRQAVHRARLVRAQEVNMDNMAETATAAIDNLIGMLADDVDPPKTLMPLKNTISEGTPGEISAALYEVMVEQALDYDVKEGKLFKTEVDYSNKDDDRVREKMAYIYSYGITMYKRGLIEPEPLQRIVVNKIAARIGLDGPGLDQWLNIPAAM